MTFATYPEIQGVEFLSRNYSTEKFDAHMHECFTIGVTLEGSERFWCRGTEHVAAAGEIALLNPHDVHKGGPGSEGWWTYRMIYPSAEVIDAAGVEFLMTARRPLRFPTVIVRDPTLAAAIASLQTAMDQADSPLERQSLLLGVLGMPPQAYLRQIKVEQAKRMLAAGMPISEVALAAGFVDQSHLTRFFKRILGVTPGAYATAIRANTDKAICV